MPPINPRLLNAVADALRIAPETITRETSQSNTAAWDSTAHLHLVLRLEAEFGVRFRTGEIPRLTSVAAIEEALAGHGQA